MKKLLFLHFTLRQKGGIERALVNLLRALPAEQYDISLQLMEHGGWFFDRLPPHVRILPPLWQYGPYSGERMAALRACGMEQAAAIRERVRTRNLERLAQGAADGELQHGNWRELRELCTGIPGEYDVAVAFFDTLPLKLCGEKVKARRKIGWVHADYHHYPIPAEHQRGYFARMDAIVCVTPRNAAAFREIFPELEDRVVCLPNLNHREEILEQAAAFVPVEYEPDTFNIFTAARLCKEKAVDWIVEAAAILKGEGLRFRWYLAGTDGDLPARDLAAAARVEDVVIFLGPLDNPYPHMLHCDLYVQPSRTEGKPIAVEEAKILRRPILLTRYSSAEESVTDGVDGMLCGMAPAAIADAVRTLAADKPLRDRLAAGIDMPEDTENSLEQYGQLWSGRTE